MSETNGERLRRGISWSTIVYTTHLNLIGKFLIYTHDKLDPTKIFENVMKEKSSLDDVSCELSGINVLSPFLLRNSPFNELKDYMNFAHYIYYIYHSLILYTHIYVYHPQNHRSI